MVLVKNDEGMDFVAFAHREATVVDARLNVSVFVKLFNPGIPGNKVADFRMRKAR